MELKSLQNQILTNHGLHAYQIWIYEWNLHSMLFFPSPEYDKNHRTKWGMIALWQFWYSEKNENLKWHYISRYSIVNLLLLHNLWNRLWRQVNLIKDLESERENVKTEETYAWQSIINYLIRDLNLLKSTTVKGTFWFSFSLDNHLFKNFQMCSSARRTQYILNIYWEFVYLKENYGNVIRFLETIDYNRYKWGLSIRISKNIERFQ